MTAYVSTFPTALGLFSVAVSAGGEVLATAFGRPAALRDRFEADALVEDNDRTRQVREQIADYLAGRRTGFDLPLSPAGTAFQKKVWTGLRAIPRGETRSYGDMAKMLGSSPRAVGRANATNPLCLVIPCHRVIGADGSLTGFAFGEDLKRRLLALEGVRTG